MLSFNQLRDIPDELANRMMVAHGSRELLRALRGEAEPVEAPVPPIIKRPRNVKYVPMAKRSPDTGAPPAVARIFASVEQHFNLVAGELLGPSRSKYLIHARAVAYRLVRDRKWESGQSRHSLPQIASYTGRDHSTVCHSLAHFDDYCRNSKTKAAYEALRDA